MNWYMEYVKAYPIISAMIQFAILGTLGDIVSYWIIKKRIFNPYKTKIIFLKMIEWAILAVFIKYAFVGFNGFVESLIAHNDLPDLAGIGKSFAISTSMNLQFGPFLVIMHRVLDNLISKQNNWKNIDKGFYSLLWFWIPAHTITFILPKEFQIGLAALWSLALGIILGIYNRE
ncbi:MAG: hypothetical protein IPJ23_10255 [Ignavibacteriales bacterium]|nr:hypothetical protein [Ignavibacteriales bacterium]